MVLLTAVIGALVLGLLVEASLFRGIRLTMTTEPPASPLSHVDRAAPAGAPQRASSC